MNNNIIKIGLGAVAALTLTLTSCNKEPDDSNLYTFTGQTINDYLLENDSLLSDFNYILKRSGYDRLLSTYGQYTCYAPINSGVESYIDSLYNDDQARILHNGLTSNSLEGLTDSLCIEIAKFHLSSRINTFLDDLQSGKGNDISTILGTPFESKLYDDGNVRFNDEAKLLSYDNEMTNGYVHIIDRIIPRQTRFLPDVMAINPQFSIFYEALQKTGLCDSMLTENKGITYTIPENAGRPGTSWVSNKFYYPETCKTRFTVFAETDSVFKANGINSFKELVEKCKDWYGESSQWYDYLNERQGELFDNGKDIIKVSESDDYTNRFNVLNMFVAYHILKSGHSYSKLVYEYSSTNGDWNFAFGQEPFDYYETLLPHTLMKIWQPYYHNNAAPNGETAYRQNIWINRYRANNTLTDEVGLMGSDAMHQLVREGCLVMPKESNIQTYNGYIHAINSPLIYDETVPKGVLNERLRLDAIAFNPEFINNDLRMASGSDIAALNYAQNGQENQGSRCLIPHNFCDGIVSYNSKASLCLCVQGTWRSWEADQLGGWGSYDFAFRLPPVPTGTYEVRILYPPMDASGFMQFYIGTSSNVGSMQPLGIPVDARYPNTSLEEDRISTGYLLSSEFDDYGVASDLAMRNHGYMRAPAGMSRGNSDGKGGSHHAPATSPDDLLADLKQCCRYEEGYGTSMIRKIVGTIRLEQGQSYWLRMKNLLPDYPQYGFNFDFVELVPTNIVNSQNYTEDWY